MATGATVVAPVSIICPCARLGAVGEDCPHGSLLSLYTVKGKLLTARHMGPRGSFYAGGNPVTR